MRWRMSSCGAMPSSVELAWPTGLHADGWSSTGTHLKLPDRAKREGKGSVDKRQELSTKNHRSLCTS